MKNKLKGWLILTGVAYVGMMIALSPYVPNVFEYSFPILAACMFLAAIILEGPRRSRNPPQTINNQSGSQWREEPVAPIDKMNRRMDDFEKRSQRAYDIISGKRKRL